MVQVPVSVAGAMIISAEASSKPVKTVDEANPLLMNAVGRLAV